MLDFATYATDQTLSAVILYLFRHPMQQSTNSLVVLAAKDVFQRRCNLRRHMRKFSHHATSDQTGLSPA